jgi:N6-L-threonylcarbamoyladenine synthase
MNILGIETSCDETAASIVRDGRKVVRSAVASQMAVHRPFRGVVPELASRAHVERINAVIDDATRGGKLDYDAIAVTTGPGLIGSLLVGVVTARTLGWVRGVPVVGMNHLEGHLFAGLVEHPRLKPPFLGLIISGGHTELVIFKTYGQYQTLGATRDDAAGEAFDKVANLLKLPFPGGPSIDRTARKGNPAAVQFPRAWMRGTWDFSFSGLKTSVANYLQNAGFGTRDSGVGSFNTNNHLPRPASHVAHRRPSLPDICASFQEAVAEVLVKKTLDAAKTYKLKSVVVGGGVAANSRVRALFQSQAKAAGVQVFLPDLAFCTDNAAMIAAGGYFKLKKLGGRGSALNVDANLPIASWKAVAR